MAISGGTPERNVSDDAVRAVLHDLLHAGVELVVGLDGGLFLVLHLMIAGRLRWKEPGAKPAGKIDLAALAFESGTLVVTEASPNKRASLHAVAGRAALEAMCYQTRDVAAAMERALQLADRLAAVEALHGARIGRRRRARRAGPRAARACRACRSAVRAPPGRRRSAGNAVTCWRGSSGTEA